jgi:7-carboxy-7-deazaguanine synthase
MRISEIFHSIQGEGELVGVPSVFVRTSGCNLRCRWCDTPYASWNPEGEEMPVAQILDTVEGDPAKHVVLTGGEPLVAKGIHELAASLREMGKHITIETAGTVAPGGIACDLASLSPKLANSTPLQGEIEAGWITRHEKARLVPEVIAEWIKHYDYQLKFVVTTAEDLVEIEELLASLGVAVPPHKVLLMPEGRDAGILRQRAGFLVDLCRKKGYRYCPRLQIDLFGDTRGT